jgi:signal transduction histidine kinase
MTVDIPDVVDQSIDLTRATVSRNIAFSVTHHKPATVWADISRIRQIVLNLLTNACESLPQAKGTVCVSTATVEVGSKDAARGLPPGHYVLLRVEDNGCGIPENALGRIFDPFFTTKFLGRGLGLAAVQGIVRSLGGMVKVESTVGIGSTFQVMLPCPTATYGYCSPSKQMLDTHGLVEHLPSSAHPVPSKLPEARSG